MVPLSSSEAIKRYIMESQSKHRRMPCKARSVPADHTAENAYFDIPPNAAHGLTLVCSYPECSLSGGRFKFCAVCDIPVAKRNFARRHSHGLLSRKGNSSSNDDPIATELARHLCIPLPLPSVKRQKTDMSEASSSHATATTAGIQNFSSLNSSKGGAGYSMTPFDLTARQGPPICHDITPGESNPKSGDWVETSMMLQDQEQKQGVMHSLFPQDKAEVSHSESQDVRESRKRQRDQITPGGSSTEKSTYKSTGETDHRPQSPSNDTGVSVMHLTSWEREWNSLLYSRPPTSDKRKMHEWMEKVLSQSECFADEDSDDDSSQEEQEVVRTKSPSQHPPPDVPVIEDTSFLSTTYEETKTGMPGTTTSSQSTFSANVASLPLPDDEQRISAPKAA